MKKIAIVLLLALSWFSACHSQKKHDCPFSFRSHSQGDRCGLLEVPLDRTSPSGAKTQIAYLVIKAKQKNNHKDPLIFIQGGPGGNVLALADAYQNLSFDRSRDFILFDQRGVGYSDPICPTLNEGLARIIAKDLDVVAEGTQLLKTISPCQAAMQGKNSPLSAYNTLENAADMEALRKHLGYEQWNLLGGSYGTRLALAYMDLYPQKVRSATLVGAFPSQVRFYENLFSNFWRSLDLVFTKCEADKECRQKYPNLESLFFEAFAALQEQPLTYEWDRQNFTLNAQDFLLMTHQLLYDRRTIGGIPNFIQNVRDRRKEALIPATAALNQRLQAFNLAVYWSVMSADEGSYNNLEFIKKDLAKHPNFTAGIGLFFSDPDVLKNWQGEDQLNTQLKIHASDIPTLFISGEMDPITPPSNADLAARSMDKAYLASFINEGHVPFTPCFYEIASTFINNPKEMPNMDCLNTPSSISWR